MNNTVGPNDVRAAAVVSCKTLSDLVEQDWSVPAGDLDWSCRQTLNHISYAQMFYASHLAFAAKERLPRTGEGTDQLTISELLLSVEVTAAVLEHVIRATPTSTRAFHPAGMADTSGFAAMSCDEILIHTADIVSGFGIDFQPPEDLCCRVLTRLFPWAPTDVGHWEALLWANGRSALPGLERQDETWRWHCAPLSEWDAQIPQRT